MTLKTRKSSCRRHLAVFKSGFGISIWLVRFGTSEMTLLELTPSANERKLPCHLPMTCVDVQIQLLWPSRVNQRFLDHALSSSVEDPV